MTKSAVWSTVAKRNIAQIKQFYDDRNKNSNYSKKLRLVFKNAAHVIEMQPEIGTRTNIERIKGFIILNYIIFYEILEDHILILMVWDSRKDPSQIEEILKSAI